MPLRRRALPLRLPGLRLPAWVPDVVHAHAGPWREAQARMALAVALARSSVERGSGGPFGAAVFERRSGRLLAVGINLVLASGCSHAHAEMVALALAQRVHPVRPAGARPPPALELVSSSEPCAMCFGALPWSAVQRLVCGARASDAEAIGFDEGPKPARWAAALERRGIEVLRDVGRQEAVAVLRAYAGAGGPIYGRPRPLSRVRRPPGGAARARASAPAAAAAPGRPARGRRPRR
jgi:tRNA(Arg) A34 adenosine deaminase TadA